MNFPSVLRCLHHQIFRNSQSWNTRQHQFIQGILFRTGRTDLQREPPALLMDLPATADQKYFMKLFSQPWAELVALRYPRRKRLSWTRESFYTKNLYVNKHSTSTFISKSSAPPQPLWSLSRCEGSGKSRLNWYLVIPGKRQLFPWNTCGKERWRAGWNSSPWHKDNLSSPIAASSPIDPSPNFTAASEEEFPSIRKDVTNFLSKPDRFLIEICKACMWI